MHDGDKKKVQIKDGVLTILPFGNNQSWVVKAPIDSTFCNASVDFNVPGKPGPPPVNLAAVFTVDIFKSEPQNSVVKFVDLSATLAPSTQPLNAWVQVADTLGDGSCPAHTVTCAYLPGKMECCTNGEGCIPNVGCRCR